MYKPQLRIPEEGSFRAEGLDTRAGEPSRAACSEAPEERQDLVNRTRFGHSL